MKRLLLLLFTIATATVTDIDGNVYETVLIGDQLWMAENLKTTHYRNGDEIPTGIDNWSSTTEGAYAIYENEPTNAEVYGNLYPVVRDFRKHGHAVPRVFFALAVNEKPGTSGIHGLIPLSGS